MKKKKNVFLYLELFLGSTEGEVYNLYSAVSSRKLVRWRGWVWMYLWFFCPSTSWWEWKRRFVAENLLFMRLWEQHDISFFFEKNPPASAACFLLMAAHVQPSLGRFQCCKRGVVQLTCRQLGLLCMEVLRSRAKGRGIVLRVWRAMDESRVSGEGERRGSWSFCGFTQYSYHMGCYILQLQNACSSGIGVAP